MWVKLGGGKWHIGVRFMDEPGLQDNQINYWGYACRSKLQTYTRIDLLQTRRTRPKKDICKHCNKGEE